MYFDHSWISVAD